MSGFPKLVENWTGEQAMTMGCNGCGPTHHVADPDVFMETVAIGSCPDCEAYAGYVEAYVQGERCKGCGELAIEQPVDGCCSRRCKLQVEYKATLERAS